MKNIKYIVVLKGSLLFHETFCHVIKVIYSEMPFTLLYLLCNSHALIAGLS